MNTTHKPIHAGYPDDNTLEAVSGYDGWVDLIREAPPHNTPIIVWTEAGSAHDTWTDGKGWYVPGTRQRWYLSVTHWQRPPISAEHQIVPTHTNQTNVQQPGQSAKMAVKPQ